LRRLRLIASEERADGEALANDEDFQRRLMDVELQLQSVEQTILRALQAFSADKEIGSVASMIKIRRSEVQQMIAELGTIAAGYYSQPYNLGALSDGWNDEPIGADYFNPLTPNYMFLRAASIYSGTNEIQHNIIAKHQLRL
jgi:alkylation response protein AidB-like acyl-CoA dehydrogenase